MREIKLTKKLKCRIVANPKGYAGCWFCSCAAYPSGKDEPTHKFLHYVTGPGGMTVYCLEHCPLCSPYRPKS